MIEKLKKEEASEEEIPEKGDYAGQIIDGVEVVDVKVLTKGLEIPEDRKTWDKP